MSDSTDKKKRNRKSFSGSYERAVDLESGRFNLPFRFRRDDDDGQPADYVVTPGLDGNLSIYLADVWDDVFGDAKAEAVTVEELALIRDISANTFDITPDSQGRVQVPSQMLKGIGVGKKVFVVGMSNHLELWDKDVYTAHQQANAHKNPDFLRKRFS